MFRVWEGISLRKHIVQLLWSVFVQGVVHGGTTTVDWTTATLVTNKKKRSYAVNTIQETRVMTMRLDVGEMRMVDLLVVHISLFELTIAGSIC